MKKFLATLALLIALVFPVTAAELKFISPFTVDSFPCRTQAWDRDWHYVQNPTGRTIYIRKVQLGMGVDMGGYGDIWTFLTRSTDGAVIAGYNWERYGTPTGLHEHVVTFGEHYMAVPANAGFLVNYGCMGLTKDKTKNGYTRVWIWYTE